MPQTQSSTIAQLSGYGKDYLSIVARCLPGDGQDQISFGLSQRNEVMRKVRP